MQSERERENLAFKDLIYFFERENERERELVGGGVRREADSMSREPHAELNPGTPGSLPESKAVA